MSALFLMTHTLQSIVALLGGELLGADRTVRALAPLESAGEDDIAFVNGVKYRKQAEASRAGTLIVPPALAEAFAGSRTLIVSDDPYLYFAKLATLFHPAPAVRPGHHPLSSIGNGARVPSSCEIGPHVSIGRDAVLGERCRLMAGSVVGDGTVLGDDVTLYPNVTIYHGCRLGDRVTIHSGSVIGADGFGLAWDKDHWFKIPQTGRVIIGNDVEVGANTTIDRGALADTVIADGAKIDNLVQVAHNVHIGEHSAIAGCVGIAGSTRIGARCTVGGAAMFVGHITVADKTHIGGGTLVSKSIRESGTYASSYPMSTMKEWMSNAVHLRHLDDLVKRVKKLERSMQEHNKDEQE